jgi:CheY-like chemotaxis protein
MPTPSRLWVIDDDRAVRFVLAEALRDAGYAVSAFEGAKQALAALEDEPAPDLVFTDVRMPEMDGLALLEALKARRPDLPAPPAPSAAARTNSCPSPSTWTRPWPWPNARCRSAPSQLQHRRRRPATN